MSLKVKTDAPPTIIIKPEQGLNRLGLGELWEYRNLIRYLLWRNVYGRYRPTNLGLLWILLTPLAYMFIYNFVFGWLFGVDTGHIPYPIFVYASVTLWFFFYGAINKATTSLTSNRGIMSKVYYPRLVTPLVAVLTELVDYIGSFIPLLVMFLYFRLWPGLTILALPLFILLTILAATTVGIWLAALAVNVRDVSVALRPAFRVLMYLSPVVYPVTRIPEKWQAIYYLNPFASIFQGYRWALFGDNAPSMASLLYTVALLVVGLMASLYYFRRVERTVIDYL